MVGPPGAGKSFFARRFADTFDAPLVSFDEIRSELFNELTYGKDEDTIVARMAGLMLRELMHAKRTIIIDGGHNQKISRQELERVVKPLGYKVLTIWVQTDEPTARMRSLRRRAQSEDDIYNRSLSEQEFVAHARKFTPPTSYEDYVVISGKHTYPTQARVVLRRIATTHKQPVSTAKSRPSSTSAPTPGRRSVRVD